MISKRPYGPYNHLTSSRLMQKEFLEIRRGLRRYAERAILISKEIDPENSNSAAKLSSLERGIQRTLDKLEEGLRQYV